MQILLKQSTAAIETIAQVFYLSEGEKHLLLAADVGQGLFFAGPAHAAMRVIASPEEHEVATTKPQEALKPKSVPPQPAQQPVTASPTGHTVTVQQPTIPPTSNRPIFTVETVDTKPIT